MAVGYEIFNREWMPDDPRGHGGDGLGPVYNDSSCVACHNSGGSGGAGPASKNIDILSASRNRMRSPASVNATENASANPQSSAFDALDPIHPGFRTARNVVLHKFGTDPNYDAWRSQALSGPESTNAVPPPQAVTSGDLDLRMGSAVETDASTRMLAERQQLINVASAQRNMVNVRSKRQNAVQSGDSRALTRIQQVQASVFASNPSLRQGSRAAGEFTVSRSQRNPTPLFGLGLIDGIPEEAIEAEAKRQAKESPETMGRASHVKDGRIGRLGWKGQVANVEDFVLNACAVELGLEVPGHHQSMTPQAPKYQTTGLDLTAEECNALVAYVRSLPKPAERHAAGVEDAKIHGMLAKRLSPASAVLAATRPRWEMSRGSTPTCFSTTWVKRRLTTARIPTAPSDDDEPLVPRISVANGKPVPAAARGTASSQGCHPTGMADTTSLGLPRLRPLSP